MNFFEKYKFELHVVRIIEFNDLKNDSHVTECSVRPYPGTKHDRELACEIFLNSIKRKRSLKIMKLVEMS